MRLKNIETKIMIIEDEQDILLLYKDFLKAKGYNVIVTSKTADDSLLDYKNFSPNITIIDYRLPNNKTGLDAAKEILNYNPDAAIIIVTAYDSIQETYNSEEAFKGKKIRLLIKPIKLAVLMETIEDIIK